MGKGTEEPGLAGFFRWLPAARGRHGAVDFRSGAPPHIADPCADVSWHRGSNLAAACSAASWRLLLEEARAAAGLLDRGTAAACFATLGERPRAGPKDRADRSRSPRR